ncbi:unnamed protein product [Leuciscus chuanchicus]
MTFLLTVSQSSHNATVTGQKNKISYLKKKLRLDLGLNEESCPPLLNFVEQKLTVSHWTLPSDLASVAAGLGSVLLVLTLCSGTFIILKKRKRKSGTGNSLFEI